VKCDASGEVIRGMMSQAEKPIAYFSNKLNEQRSNYSFYDKEFYVMVQALKKGRHYLMSREFIF